MDTFIMILGCCIPIFVGAVGAVYLGHLRKAEERDEKEYFKTLTEDEKIMYQREKSRALLKEQEAYAINGVAAGRKDF